MTYDRTVFAALTETKSKFKLAEALALDIPPRRRGPTEEDEKSVPKHIADARQKIIDAGGEDRYIETLTEYRSTALWVSCPETGNFHWIEGASFTAHRRAWRAGLSYEEFAKLDDKTGDAANEAAGRAPIRGTVSPQTMAGLEVWLSGLAA